MFKKHFRFNNKRKHPSYVYKEKNGNYHSVIITHSSNKNIKLHKNPNKNDKRDSYVVPRVYKDSKKTFGKKYKGWKLSLIDKLKIFKIRHKK